MYVMPKNAQKRQNRIVKIAQRMYSFKLKAHYKEGKMPHITIQMYPGRDDEKKRRLADDVVKAASASLEIPEKSFSVSIVDVPQDEWTEKVYKDAVDPNNKTIYRRPGY